MPPSLPAGFVDLRTVLPAARFSIGYATPDNFTGAPLPGYGAPGAWMLEGAAESLLARGVCRLELAGLVSHGSRHPV